MVAFGGAGGGFGGFHPQIWTKPTLLGLLKRSAHDLSRCRDARAVQMSTRGRPQARSQGVFHWARRSHALATWGGGETGTPYLGSQFCIRIKAYAFSRVCVCVCVMRSLVQWLAAQALAARFINVIRQR